MNKLISLTIETLTAEQQAECLITSSRQMQSILEYLKKQESKVALYFQHNQQFIISRLVDYDDTHVYLDPSKKPEFNQHIEHSDTLTLVALHNQVKVQCSPSNPQPDHRNAQPVIKCELPDNLFRIQRREYFRVDTSNSIPLKCNIFLQQENKTYQAQVNILNISGGGIGIICTQQQSPLESGKQYAYQIELPGEGVINGTLEIKTLTEMQDTPADSCQHYIGCQFIDLSRQSEITLQRYITNMQRKR